MGFTTRAVDGAIDGVPFDATDIVSAGTFEFDLNLVPTK